MRYLFIALIVFGVNLLPAFGPPTWSLLVVARLSWHLNSFALVALGVVAAGAGRFLLAHAARRLRYRFPPRYRANLESIEQRLVGRRANLAVIFGIFVLSPLPSAQLFCAAGLLELRILALTAAFMVGRIVTYSLYVAAATVADEQLGSVFRHFWGSPWSIALQLLLLICVAALPLLPWRQGSKSTSVPAP